MTLGSLFDGSGGFPLGWRKVFKTYYTINGKKTVKIELKMRRSKNEE